MVGLELVLGVSAHCYLKSYGLYRVLTAASTEDIALIEASYCVIRILQNFPGIKLPPGEPQEPTGQEKQLLQYVLIFPQIPKNVFDKSVLFVDAISLEGLVPGFMLHGRVRLTLILGSESSFRPPTAVKSCFLELWRWFMHF